MIFGVLFRTVDHERQPPFRCPTSRSVTALHRRRIGLWTVRGVFWGFVCGEHRWSSTVGAATVHAVDDHPDAVAAVVAAYAGADRPGRPWVLLNMVTSIDGGVALDGVSGGLGGAADKAVFGTLRGVADVIVVASATAMAENYGPPTVRPDMAIWRRAAGKAPLPTIAVCSRSLDMDLDARLFTTPGFRPTVVTVADADPEARRRMAEVADVVVAGTGDLDLTDAMARLAERVGPVVLVEGGPTLNAQIAAADLFDELCVSTGPLLIGGDGPRMVRNGPAHDPLAFRVDGAWTAGDMVFTRWLRDR